MRGLTHPVSGKSRENIWRTVLFQSRQAGDRHRPRELGRTGPATAESVHGLGRGSRHADACGAALVSAACLVYDKWKSQIGADLVTKAEMSVVTAKM
jgi:hypothetical protein